MSRKAKIVATLAKWTIKKMNQVLSHLFRRVEKQSMGDWQMMCIFL
jgi:hypothetical protein